jgi:hypothetical protein
MGVRRQLAKRAVVASAAGTPFLLGVGPAEAFEDFYGQAATFAHSYTNRDGQTVVCRVDFSSELYRNTSSGPFLGSAFTGTGQVGDESCQLAALSRVEVSYYDLAGVSKNASSSTNGDNVFMQVDDVGSGFVVRHSIQFGFDCVSDCEVSYTTRPK